MSENNLPIQIVLSRIQDTVPNPRGGRDKFFCDVDDTVLNQLSKQVSNIENYFNKNASYMQGVPAVAILKMRDNAEAKSHKPNRFCANGLQIIGAKEFGEILVKVTPEGIKKTKEELKSIRGKNYLANVSAIDDLAPFMPDDFLVPSEDKKIRKELESEGQAIIKVSTFNFNDEAANIKSENYLKTKIGDIEIEKKDYFTDLNLYKIKINNISQLENLIKCSFIRKISKSDRFSAISSIHNTEILKKINGLEKGEIGESYIGIIDGGISEENTILNDMVESREMYVPYDYQDRRHGTFVAGMIQNGDVINGLNYANNTQYKLIDVIAMPNSDSHYGMTDTINELDLMDIIVEVLEKYSNNVKIWNLSLNNTNKKCRDDEISDFGAFIDNMQKRYNVQFVISVGNYEEEPLRSWPVMEDLEYDRIVSPSDSVYAISVGSISHKEDANSIVNVYEPSPFSRRGPGMNYTIKPDLVDFGGNIRLDGTFNNIGVLSFGEDGNVVESVGTSYSTPRITKKLASVYDSTLNADLLLSKGLLVHSARFSECGRSITSNEAKYFGFGLPPNNVSDIINCSQDKVTLIFDQVIERGSHLEIREFPYPESLRRAGKWTGEITMTLVYEPLLDKNFGNEYCRANVEVSFGTYKYNPRTEKVDFHGQVPPEVNWDSRYEVSRVENGFKWNPIKSYHRKLRGIRGDDWKLRISYSPRNEANIDKQRVVLIMTIEDENGSDIYTDVINQLQLSGFVFNDLKLKTSIQTRAQN